MNHPFAVLDPPQRHRVTDVVGVSNDALERDVLLGELNRRPADALVCRVLDRLGVALFRHGQQQRPLVGDLVVVRSLQRL